jgi:hypothetical protein
MRAIWDFISFWVDCVLSGWTTGKIVFTVVEVVLLLSWLYYTFKKRDLKPFEEKLKERSKYLFFAAFGFSTIFLAPFLKYQSEKISKEIAEKSLQDKSPKLECFVHRTFVGDDGANSLIFLDVSIDNSGGTPSVAEEYRLSVILPNRAVTNANVINIPDEYKLNFLWKEKPWLLDLKRPQLISEKTSKPIQNSDHPRGWTAFRLNGIPMQKFTSTNIILSFSDWTGAKTFVTNGFWRGRLGELADFDLTTVVPGAENIFFPIEPPARTNWLPPELPPGCSNVVIYLGNYGLTIPRKMAEITSSGTKFTISELPDFLLTDLDKMSDYSPRQREMWVRKESSKYTIGGRTIDYPVQPVVISNRLYVEVEIPFSNERRELIMSDVFSSDLPIPRDWDVNFSTNYDAYGNGVYAFEVVNELRNPVLQVGYTSPNEIHVNGIFQVDSNCILAAFGDLPTLGTFTFTNLDINHGLMTASLQVENFHETLIVRSNETLASFGQRFTNEFFRPMFKYQKPIFKYPSNRHPGEFADGVLLR